MMTDLPRPVAGSAAPARRRRMSGSVSPANPSDPRWSTSRRVSPFRYDRRGPWNVNMGVLPANPERERRGATPNPPRRSRSGFAKTSHQILDGLAAVHDGHGAALRGVVHLGGI